MNTPKRLYFPIIRMNPGVVFPPRRLRRIPKNGLRKKMKFLLDDFLENSTIHGLGHLATKKRHSIEYLLWMLTLLAAITGMGYMGINAWGRYQLKPTFMSMEKNYKNWNTSFATGTICPDYRIDEDKLRRLSERYNVRNKENFIRFFNVLSSATYSNFDMLPDYNEVNPKDYIKILDEGKFNFSFDLSNTQGTELKPMLIVTEYGLCYGINSDLGMYFQASNFNQKLPVSRWNSDLVIGNPLDGEIFIQLMNMNSPYNVCITAPFDIPDVNTRKAASAMNRYFIMEVTALPIVSSNRIRSLTPKQRKCRFYDESELEISDVYSYNLCRMQCRADLAYKLCKCIPYFYKKSNSRPYCDTSGMKCLGKHGRYLSDLRDSAADEKIRCSCLPLCNDFHYLIAQEDLILWPKFIHFKWAMIDFPRTRLKREVIFGFDDFLVSLGGSAGLLLGCSVLSFIEIVYFFTLRLFFFVRSYRKRKLTEPIIPSGKAEKTKLTLF